MPPCTPTCFFYIYVSVSLFTDKPGAPKNLHATEVSAQCVDITYETPDEDGGAPIISYIIERQQTNRLFYQTFMQMLFMWNGFELVI